MRTGFKKSINAEGCGVEGCVAVAASKGLCKYHYERIRTGRAPVKPTRMEVFLSRIAQDDSSGCWVWTAGRARAGYGVFGMDGRTITAHRAAWRLFRGEIPRGVFVCHHCDNPPCCNPDHLFLGTCADNVADMISKDRHARRERNGHAKLNSRTVAAIRRCRGLSHRELAERYGVSRSLIGMVLARKRWP